MAYVVMAYVVMTCMVMAYTVIACLRRLTIMINQRSGSLEV